MARRMFSPKITFSDKFLDMPVSARELYFQLGMNADDDGFVTPKKIIRMIGAQEEDLKTLIENGFLIQFESGVVVIVAWKINNFIRKDWYQETIYLKEKQQLTINENSEYIFVNELVNETVTISSTQVRLGKDRLGKDRLDQVYQDQDININRDNNNINIVLSDDTQKTKNKKNIDNYSESFESFWSFYPKRAGSNGKQSAWKAWKARVKEGAKEEDIIGGAMRYQNYCNQTEKTGTEFVKMASTFLSKDKYWENNWEVSKNDIHIKKRAEREFAAKRAADIREALDFFDLNDVP